MRIRLEDIWKQTDNGLNIILDYYPEAEPGVRNHSHKFKIREDEKTASSVLFCGSDGIWRVKDFGSSSKAENGIDVVIREERLDFENALAFVATKYNLTADDGSLTANSAQYSMRDAEEGDAENAVRWQKREASIADLKVLFSKNVWVYLSKKGKAKETETPDETAHRHGLEVLKKYRLSALEWYEMVKYQKDKTTKQRTDRLVVHKFEATERYPIFMYNEGSWQKFYQPLHHDKSRRFFSTGNKPEKYIFGIEQARKAHDDLTNKELGSRPEDDEAAAEYEAKRKNIKLPEIILCSGGSDALNVAALGYQVIWFNSETIDKYDIPMPRLRGMAHRIYNLPDIDATGVEEAMKLATEYLDVSTIWLPERLEEGKDARHWGKDVRDFFRYRTARDFENLLKVSYPFRFWEEQQQVDRKGYPIMHLGKPKVKYTPDPMLVRNFLKFQGFGKIKLAEDVEEFVALKGHVVCKSTPAEMRTYVFDFLEKRHMEKDLMNAFIKTKDLTDGMFEKLHRLSLNFTDYGKNYQIFHFQNETWCVTPAGIVAAKDGNYVVWDREVIRRNVSIGAPQFEIWYDEKGRTRCRVLSTECPFMRFLIQTSRVHWRKELEDRLDEYSVEFRQEYREKYACSLNGELLSDDEQAEQELHLANKLVAYGYLLHRYKSKATTLAIWAMDYVMDDPDESNGGTGKSLGFSALITSGLIPGEVLNGRDTKLLADTHVFASVSEHTDLILLDDAQKQTDLGFFFSIITDAFPVRPLGKARFTIPYELSPKVCITSNFPPFGLDSSNLRRLWFTATSDYYHYNKTGKYREERRPTDEYGGKSLFEDFSDEEWNSYFNLMAQATQAWMNHGVIAPPMEAIMGNAYRNKLGSNFTAWADVYINSEQGTLDDYVQKQRLEIAFENETGLKITASGFKSKLETYCKLKGYELNPKECKGYRAVDKRITMFDVPEYWDNKEKVWRTVGDQKKTVELIYIRSKADKPITPYRSYAERQAEAQPLRPLGPDGLPF